MDYETKNKRSKRIAAFVASGAIAVLSVGFLGSGALLVWADSEGDRDGYISTDTERFHSGGRALATENLDVELDGPETVLEDGALGNLRVRAESSDGKPVFLGVARTSDVEDYLRGTEHDIVTDLEYSPFDADYERHAGERRLAAPAQQDFWAASAHGSGERALTWDVEDGDWSVVVMNADGSSGVDAGISAAVKVAWLDEAGIAALSTGFVLLALAGGIAVLGVRARPRVAAEQQAAA